MTETFEYQSAQPYESHSGGKGAPCCRTSAFESRAANMAERNPIAISPGKCQGSRRR